MANNLMSGLWRLMIGVPPSLWEKQIAKVAANAKEKVGAMSREEQAVHHHVVRQLPRVARPLPPEEIAQDLGLSVPRVREILDDLERGMTFLFRNHKGEVLWAYPVTVAQTPHRVTFSSGERLYAA